MAQRFGRRRYADDSGHVEEREVVKRTGYDEAPVRNDAVYDDAVTTERHYSASYFDSLPARVNAVLFAFLLGLESLLTLRFVLAAFGANPNNSFVDFIRDVSWPFVRPFDGAFSNRTWDEGVIEVSTLLAMGIWFLAFALVMLLVNAVLPRIEEDGATVHRRRVTHV
jgi:hypothetical protein